MFKFIKTKNTYFSPHTFTVNHFRTLHKCIAWAACEVAKAFESGSIWILSLAATATGIITENKRKSFSLAERV